MQSGGTIGVVFERVYGTGKYELHGRNKYKFSDNMFLRQSFNSF
jgi:hypothetical protein